MSDSPATGRSVKVFPDVPDKRRATIFGDVVVIVLLVLAAWAGVAVHDAVDRLAVLGAGVSNGGHTVQAGFGSAAAKVDGVPLVGGSLADALRGAGRESGGRAVELGQRGQDSVHRLALILGVVVFAVPAIVLLGLFVPRRVRQIRRLTAAARALAPPYDADRRRVLAMRAAFGLPYGALLPYTPDPLGDIVQGRYDALVLAALHDAGIRPPPGGIDAGAA
jgi:hypothetical protein